MRKTKILAIWLLITFLLPILTFADYWIYYGTNQSYATKTFSKFDIMIIQPYNFNLYKNYTGKKVCYLTVWEFDGTQEELETLWLSQAKIWVNTEWNSIIMNMSDINWQNYLLSKSNELNQMGCHGMFLDTIWNDGQEAGWIEIVKKLRNNWSNAIIIPNNPHNIKEAIIDYVDGAMFENFWDYGTLENSSDGLWYKNLAQQYKDLYTSKWKPVYALSYGNPYQNTTLKKWGQKVVSLATNYNFQVVFSDYNLTKIFAYKKGTTLTQFK